MSGKINLDFSSSIKQIEELKSAAQAFGQVMQDILSTSSRFGNIAQQAMTGVNQANLGMPGQASQAQGSNIDQLGSIKARMMENQQQINDFHRAHPGAVQFAAGKYRVPGSTGTFVKDLGGIYSEQAELKRKSREIEANQPRKAAGEDIANQVREAQAQAEKAPASFNTGTAMKFSALGYSMADLPGMLIRSAGVAGKDGDLKRIEQTIKGLEGSGDKNSAIAAGVLKDVAKSLKDAQSEFTKAVSAYNDPLTKEDPKKQVEATERLIQAMAGLDDTLQQSKDAERGSRGLKGGGGDGGGQREDTIGGLPPSRAVSIGKAVMAVAGAGVAGAQFAQQFSIGVGRAVVGGEIEKLMATGQFAEQKFRDTVASKDMTSVENMFRYRGDDLLGKKSQFLGASGFERAMSLAGEKQSMEVDLLRQERNAAKWGAIGQIGMGALQLGGAALTMGTGFGAVFGAGLAMNGIATVMGGGKDLISSFTGSPYSQLTGELATGAVGYGARMAYGEGFDQLSSQKQQALIVKYNAEQYATARGLQDAEMQRQRPMMAGYQEVINTIESQQQGAVLVGEYAARGGARAARAALDKQMPLAYKTAYQEERQLDLQAAQVAKYTNDRVVATDRHQKRDEKASKAPYMGFGASAGFGYLPPVTKAQDSSKVDDSEIPAASQNYKAKSELFFANMNAMKANADKSNETQATQGKMSTHARLEMSLSEFNRNRDQVTNVLGGSGVASEGQTERLTQLGRSGLGDFGSMINNMAGLNRATGGQDNTGKLETVLANAVASGFDKSRTSQQFAQTVIGLSEQANVSNVGVVAGTLREASAGLGIGGVADEKSMRLAATGIANYTNYTKQVTNTQGILGMSALYNQGMGLGQGGALASGMSNLELTDAIEQLKSGNVTSRNVKAMLSVSGKSKEELAKTLTFARSEKNELFKAAFRNKTGMDMDEVSSKVSELSKDKSPKGKKALQEYLEKYQGFAMETGATMTGVEAEGGVVAFNEIVKEKNPNNINVKNLLNKKVQNSPFTDVAKQQRQAFLDSLTAGALVNDKFGGGTKGVNGAVTKEERDLYFKSLEMGGQTSVIQSGKLAGKAITEDAYNNGTAEFKNEADKELKNLSRMDIIRNTNYAAAMQNSNIQQVYVTNLTDIQTFDARAEEIRRQLNKK
jgi:hypothetical protein